MSFTIRTSGKRFECPDNVNADAIEVLSGEYDLPDFAVRGGRMIVLDVGANVGAYTLYAATAWPLAIIHAYEPSPAAREFLLRNIETFGLGHRVVIHESAVGESNAKTSLYEGRASGEANLCCASLLDPRLVAGAARLREDENRTDDPCTRPIPPSVIVDMVDAETLPMADVLKVDTEGFELPIISRYLATHRSEPPAAIVFEWHTKDDRLAIHDELDRAWGFELVRGIIRSRDLGTFLYLRRKGILERS